MTVNASFETTAVQSPQNDGFSSVIQTHRHPEERPSGCVSKDATCYLTTIVPTMCVWIEQKYL